MSEEKTLEPGIPPEVHQRLVADLVEGQRDVRGLAERHGLPLGALSRWSDRPEVRRELDGLCRIHDYQAQLLLSRFRGTTAAELISIASGQRGATPDVTRKACVDVLRTEVRRAALPEARTPAGARAEPRALDTPEELLRQRESFYAELHGSRPQPDTRSQS